MTNPPPESWPPPQNRQPGLPPGFPPGSPQWGPPQQSGQPPPNGGSRSKWILGGLALLVVVVVTVVATLLFTRDDSGSTPPVASSPPSTSVDTSDIASADDRDPAGIITEDPTCQSWTTISAAYFHASSSGWDKRDPTIPATAWTTDQKNQYEAVGAALRDAADRSVNLARETPHRVMRELYEQFITYSRDYVDRIPHYTNDANQFVLVVNSISSTLNAVCAAITYGAAGARAPLVARAAPPRGPARSANPRDPEPFLTSANPVCASWLSAAKQFTDDTTAWRSIDPNTPAAELNFDQRAINNAVMPIMQAFANESQQLGRQSDNAVWEDFATLSAQYRRAYASALLTYAPADNDLQVVAGSAAGTISEACRTVGS